MQAEQTLAAEVKASGAYLEETRGGYIVHDKPFPRVKRATKAKPRKSVLRKKTKASRRANKKRRK